MQHGTRLRTAASISAWLRFSVNGRLRARASEALEKKATISEGSAIFAIGLDLASFSQSSAISANHATVNLASAWAISPFSLWRTPVDIPPLPSCSCSGSASPVAIINDKHHGAIGFDG